MTDIHPMWARFARQQKKHRAVIKRAKARLAELTATEHLHPDLVPLAVLVLKCAPLLSALETGWVPSERSLAKLRRAIVAASK